VRDDFKMGIFITACVIALTFGIGSIGSCVKREAVKRCSQVVCIQPEPELEEINVNCIEQCANIVLR